MRHILKYQKETREGEVGRGGVGWQKQTPVADLAEEAWVWLHLLSPVSQPFISIAVTCILLPTHKNGYNCNQTRESAQVRRKVIPQGFILGN